MTLRPLNTDEIKLVAEINESAQKLDIIGKAKAAGFISGLMAHEPMPIKMSREPMHIGAARGATI